MPADRPTDRSADQPEERTEQPTKHRREKARRDGDILHSRELSAAAGTLAGVLALGMLGPRTMEAWRNAYAGFLALGTLAHWEPAALEPTLDAARHLTIEVLGPPAIVMALVAMAALAAGIAQTGGISVHMNAMAWKPDRINPISNLKTLFSLRAAARLARSLIPVAILAVFAVQRIARQRDIPSFSPQRLEILGHDIYGLLLAAAWLLFAWSAIDYLVEWRSRESRLKMSRQDLRDELQETEGNPQIRARRRSLQRQARRRDHAGGNQ
jgi:flagellar biosynthetic protein FlhB